MSEPGLGLDRSFKSLAIIVIILAAFHFGGNLIMPILFSGLVAIILTPFADFMERKKIPRGLSAVLAVLVASLFLIGILFMLVIQSQEIVNEVPRLIIQKSETFDVREIQVRSKVVIDYIEEHITTIEESIEQLKSTSISILKSSLIGLKDTILFLIICPVYIFFMLLCRDNVYHFFLGFYERNGSAGEKDKKLIKDIKDSLFHYLKGLALIMSISGTLTAIGLYSIGLDYALFLGVLTAALTPIPYIGVTISAIIPILLAFLTKDGYMTAVGVLIVFAIVQFLENYVLTPKIMGKSINVNPLIIILGLIIFGAISGVIGMILTVPILAIIKLIVSHYPYLRPWKLLLQDKKND